MEWCDYRKMVCSVFLWKMPLGVQGSLYTLDANKNFTKPPADLNTKAQLANWQVTSTQASLTCTHVCACVPADLRILRYLPGAIQEICQPYLQNQPIRQSSCDTTYSIVSFHVFPKKYTFWVPRFDDVNQGSLTDNLGKHASVQMGRIPWLCSASCSWRTGRPGQLLRFSKLRHWNHASGLVSVQFWPDKFTKSWNLTT